MGTAALLSSPARTGRLLPLEPRPPHPSWPTQDCVHPLLLLIPRPASSQCSKQLDTFSKFSGHCCFLLKFLAAPSAPPCHGKGRSARTLARLGPGRGRSSWPGPAAVRCGGAKEKSPDYGGVMGKLRGDAPQTPPARSPVPLLHWISGLQVAPEGGGWGSNRNHCVRLATGSAPQVHQPGQSYLAQGAGTSPDTHSWDPGWASHALTWPAGGLHRQGPGCVEGASRGARRPPGKAGTWAGPQECTGPELLGAGPALPGPARGLRGPKDVFAQAQLSARCPTPQPQVGSLPTTGEQGARLQTPGLLSHVFAGPPWSQPAQSCTTALDPSEVARPALFCWTAARGGLQQRSGLGLQPAAPTRAWTLGLPQAGRPPLAQLPAPPSCSSNSTLSSSHFLILSVTKIIIPSPAYRTTPRQCGLVSTLADFDLQLAT